MPLKKDISGTWKNICKVSNELNTHNLNPYVSIQVDIGNGVNTSFWHDSWIHDSPLCSIFPNLYRLETVKDVVVDACFDCINGGKVWKWRWVCSSLTDCDRSELEDCMIVVFLIKFSLSSFLYMGLAPC
ncbi:hypothetical protein QVD17_37363 [Tagetes erecta]|uniref:RNA-directed DNA polymerase, eukaryota, Reverse transcriptase zinc-binding domain protein n=1 Tax=Tagetes erecta TaxID=13708 RepID=A0AAD8NJ42_TARER|nr:hypothetical protein QVD17_37363 [Tagetes erecta]